MSSSPVKARKPADSANFHRFSTTLNKFFKCSQTVFHFHLNSLALLLSVWIWILIESKMQKLEFRCQQNLLESLKHFSSFSAAALSSSTSPRHSAGESVKVSCSSSRVKLLKENLHAERTFSLALKGSTFPHLLHAGLGRASFSHIKSYTMRLEKVFFFLSSSPFFFCSSCWFVRGHRRRILFPFFSSCSMAPISYTTNTKMTTVEAWNYEPFVVGFPL